MGQTSPNEHCPAKPTKSTTIIIRFKIKMIMFQTPNVSVASRKRRDQVRQNAPNLTSCSIECTLIGMRVHFTSEIYFCQRRFSETFSFSQGQIKALLNLHLVCNLG